VNNTAGRIVSINSSPGGVPKRPLASATVTGLGLIDDDHDDHEGHGGPDRAVVLFSLELIEALKREGHPIDIGSTGENLTVAGLDWVSMIPGARLSVGDGVKLEITSFTSPCKTIAGSFLDRKFSRISQKVHPGWSRVCAKVLNPGVVQAGDEIRLDQAVS
jgi:MOSC domain-containing protein YiiM